MKRFKKPKPISRKKIPVVRPLVSAAPAYPRVIAGFPEFWQKAYDHYRNFFQAAGDLAPLVNKFLSRGVQGPLATVEYFIAAIVANSLGALITLALNGYGHDAVRVARGMYESAVNAAYLKVHPNEVDDYTDFHWVRQKKLYDYFQKYKPSVLEQIPPHTISEMKSQLAELAKAKRFQDRRGNLRDSWCKKNLRSRAEEVGLGELYPTFYAYASGLHHGDISGLIAQSAKDALRVEVAPSFDALGDALMMGHNAVLNVLDSLNHAAGLDLDGELNAARAAFMKAWNR